MFSKYFLLLGFLGLPTLISVTSSKFPVNRYWYKHDQNTENSAKDYTESRTKYIPLIFSNERVKRDTNSDNVTDSKVSSEKSENKFNDSNSTNDPDQDVLKDDFLKKQVFLNKSSAEKNIDAHNNKDEFNFENDTIHKYYTHIIEQEKDYFYDLDIQNNTGPNAGRVTEHNMLSQSYRRAATINLSFKFPFYGHPVENITIATGGFLYTGDYVHSWLAATQYIAPLMANFDTSSTHNAKIRYLDDGDKLIVEWKDVYLQEATSGRDGPFTFQVILFSNGNITFAYKVIPIDITIITDDDHPVKVGLSDAYIIDRTVYFARRKTIYEYHRMNMKDKNIRNKTAILFSTLPTCNINTDCGSCLANDFEYDQNDLDAHKVKCSWCEALHTCSDGTDRKRQDWLKAKCDTYNVSNVDYCSVPGHHKIYSGSTNIHSFDGSSQSHISHLPEYSDFDSKPAESVATGSIVISLLVTLLVFTFFGWLGYAYFNPNTASGRFLIKYRPGAWRWRQSGARYTAASIHM